MSATVSVNAVCVIHASDGVSGTVRFTQSIAANGSAGVMHVGGRVTGLSQGTHQLHICAFGDLTNGGISCGPLFDPRGDALLDQTCAGDLGVHEVGEDGIVEIEIEAEKVHLTGPESIIGRSFVLVEVVPPPDVSAEAGTEAEAEPATPAPKGGKDKAAKGKDAKSVEAEPEVEAEPVDTKTPETQYIRKAAGLIGIAKLHQSMMHAMKANLKESHSTSTAN